MNDKTNTTPYPDAEVEIGHADAGLVKVIERVYDSKNSGSPERFSKEFSAHLLTYTDAVLGWQLVSNAALKSALEQFMPNWKDGRAFPLRIIGAPNSAVICWTDTPELFGDELHGLAAVDLADGKVVRWVDYWDSTTFNPLLFDRMAAPDDQYPADFGAAPTTDNGSEVVRRIVEKLHAAVSSGDGEAAGSLFSFSARFEDMAIRTLITGRSAISRYISRLRGDAPYGTGSDLRHVLGGPLGGGYEWIASPSSNVRCGITALEFDRQGQISRFTTIYDARRLPADVRRDLILRGQDA